MIYSLVTEIGNLLGRIFVRRLLVVSDNVLHCKTGSTTDDTFVNENIFYVPITIRTFGRIILMNVVVDVILVGVAQIIIKQVKPTCLNVLVGYLVEILFVSLRKQMSDGYIVLILIVFDKVSDPTLVGIVL
jgi:hypothetical protein